MEASLPLSVRPCIEEYLRALEPLHTHFYGMYVYGSIALDAFAETESDIDIVALTQGEWTARKLTLLEAVHAQLLREYPLAKRLEILYVPFCDIGKQNNEIEPYPTFHDGKFSSASRGDLNAVTWWIIQHKGIRLLGPECSSLPLDVAWKGVLRAMRYNLDGYWADKAKRPYLFLFDFWVVFAVSTLCRILTTIEEGEIIAKSSALMRWRDRLSGRWSMLIDEAQRIRQHSERRSLYRSRFKRMRETVAFIGYVRKRGIEKLMKSPLE